jgi:hypothetical protein
MAMRLGYCSGQLPPLLAHALALGCEQLMLHC